MDIIGKQFGRLTVIAEDSNRAHYVICKCNCGNRVSIRASSLTKSKNPTRSCGCIQREFSVQNGKRTVHKNFARQIALNTTLHTNVQVISTKNLPKNNKSGHKGVWWNGARKLWEAYISFHGERINLGRFTNYEDAVKAREDAEKLYFEPVIQVLRGDTKNASD